MAKVRCAAIFALSLGLAASVAAQDGQLMQRKAEMLRALAPKIGGIPPGLSGPSSIQVGPLGTCTAWLGYASPTAETLLGVTWTGSKFVAVGTGGVAATSSDGIAWNVSYPSVMDLARVAWNGSLLVAVGASGAIYTSTDGSSWEEQGSPTSNELRGIAWNGTVFVAVGRGGTILRSATGTSWTGIGSPTSADIFAVTAMNSTFVAIADNGTALVSTDGQAWSTSTISGFPQYGSILSLTSNPAMFVGVGFTVNTDFTYGILLYHSSDGINWTQRTMWNGTLRGVRWGREKFVAVGDSTIVESPDGVNWSTVGTPLSGSIWDTIQGGNTFVAVGASGIAVSTCTISQNPTYAYWIPVASHGNGLNGSQWRSDLGMLNTTSAIANVQLRFVASTVISSTTSVPAGAQSILTDVVGQLGASGSAAIEVLSDQPLKVTSRTYNLVPSTAPCYPGGTQGQGYPAILAASALSAGQTAYLAGLTENASYRCNVGVVNTGANSATVLVTLFDGAGDNLGNYTVNLAAGQWTQATQPFLNVAAQTAMDRGYASVTVQSGAGVAAFASVIDNITNDPTTVALQD